MTTMPVLFVGHGSPMNAVAENAFTRDLSALAPKLPKPKAVLVVSAHWLTRGTYFTTSERPGQIYDFYGFPELLYDIDYKTPGAPQVAKEAIEEIKSVKACGDDRRGIDHAGWVVLKHLYPNKDVPVIQMSIDPTRSPKFHYDLAGELAELRKKGVLIVGSGNLVHNLGIIDWNENAKPLDWAVEFDSKAKTALLDRNHEPLIEYEKFGPSAALAVPTNDHYLPLLYAIGLQKVSEKVSFFHESFQNASVSMRCLKID